MKGNHSTDLPGQKTWKDVWDATFCPIVIYTGWEGDIQPTVPANHPFVKLIAKGGGTLAAVVAALNGFAPAVDSVSKLRAEVDAVIHRVLRDTAGDGHLPMSDASHLLHAGRRRIAATMDDSTITSNRPMASWEQYLIPAMGESPLTADVLRKRDAQWDDPTAYRLVLTPSCDLVKGRCEQTLIAACCEGTARLAQKLSLSPNPNKLDDNAKTVIAKALTAGAFQGFLPLPGFPSRLPVMVANLKGLEVIQWESVGPVDSSTHEFVRVASIDSPFREQVAWAYLTTAARPGMPDRDLKPWAEEVVKAATPPATAPPQASNAAAGA
jgi:CTP synthase